MTWCEIFKIMFDEYHNRELRMYNHGHGLKIMFKM